MGLTSAREGIEGPAWAKESKVCKSQMADKQRLAQDDAATPTTILMIRITTIRISIMMITIFSNNINTSYDYMLIVWVLGVYLYPL
jgi:hypothetical protein